MSSAVDDNSLLHVRHYDSQQHGSKVVSGFQELWQKQLMCDTTLTVDEQTFRVHRSFLASCSQYFFSMFTEGFSESGRDEVELHGVTTKGLQTMLEFAYTGHMLVHQDSLQEVLEAAAHLQFTEALDFCAQYLQEELSHENCLTFLNMAELYQLNVAKEKIKWFILENFVPVAERDEFYNMPLEMFCEFLAEDSLQAQSELELFNIALRWLEEDKTRKSHVQKVLGLIRYGLMSAEEMETVYCNPIMLSKPCQPVLQSALHYHMKLFTQPMNNTAMAKVRSYADSIVILGAGKTNNDLCRHIQTSRIDKNGKIGQFCSISKVKDPRYFAAVAVMNNFVFVVGGQSAMAGDGSHATSTAFRYNPRDGKWLQVSSMSTPRTHFTLVAVSTGLVAVGGKFNRTALPSAERYDFKSNEWNKIASLPNTLFSHAGCAHKNQVYISGGCPGDDFTDQVHCYDPDRDGWLLRGPLNQSRGYHAMLTLEDKIYTFAGNTNAGNRSDVLNTECYDVETDQWTVLTPMGQGQSEAPAVHCGNKVYILGGYSWDAQAFRESIQCYDIETDKWEVLTSHLPEPLTGLVACRLQMPLNLLSGNAELAED